ncbi:TolB family protein [Cellulomonas cellasea]|uniref:Lipoprotein LpqB beta-propeller domain-containing protein n=2 Tax=Cellulomonas cellasea TaxID=43670 RepID=A0A0A0BBF6_9CELL|nr:hypothetical protein [Cellulomonas cellasea]KGM03234.1 hypothetical protein Q760_08715 [Cellulomonas cellasea DSM 20118]GEA89771.1 hypothetical protein CCE01nite_37200 [Cellulomonas cellasea]
MGYDLRRGLHDLGDQPPQGGTPLDADRVLGRVRRARAARAAAVGVTSAAAVLGLTFAVQAFPLTDDGPRPGPAATSEPAPTPTPTAAPEPSPTPTQAPTSTPEPTQAPPLTPLVAVTVSGEIVTLDPVTGERLSTLHTGLGVDDPSKVSVTTDGSGTVAWVSHDPSWTDPQILYVPMDGSGPAALGSGWSPVVSPDGRRLVARAVDPATDASTLAVFDLVEGGVRYLAPGDGGAGRWFEPQSWSPDGSTLYLTIGVEDGWAAWTLPVTATSLDEAVLIDASTDTPWWTAESFGPDVLAVGVREGGWDPSPEGFALLLVDRATGAQVDEIEGARGKDVWQIAGTSDGGLVVLARDASGTGPEADLYRWDGAEGLVLLGEGFVAVDG